MPIKEHIDMLSHGMRTRVGLKIQGDELEKIREIGEFDMWEFRATGIINSCKEKSDLFAF
jgi:Cu/Ag efflux pump CusA